ncbi:trifunctional histidinol dehydrogenase, partial [Ceratobasidium sp. 395]
MSTPAFLPLLDAGDEELVNAATRCGPVLLPSQSQHSLAPGSTYYVLPDVSSPPSVDQIATWLDRGASKVIISLGLAKDLAGVIPADKLVLLLDAGSASAVTDKVRATVSSVLLKTPT